MPGIRKFSWSADNTLPARLLRVFPKSPWRYKRILGVHRFYKKLNLRFRNLPAAMPEDFQLTCYSSHSQAGKTTVQIFVITPVKCTSRISVQTDQQRREKLQVQWTEKYSDVDRRDVEELYQVLRSTGCIYFDTEKGMEVSFIGYYQYSIALVAAGVEYEFGDSTSEPYYSHWSNESEKFYQELFDFLSRNKVYSPRISKAIPEE